MRVVRFVSDILRLRSLKMSCQTIAVTAFCDDEIVLQKQKHHFNLHDALCSTSIWSEHYKPESSGNNSWYEEARNTREGELVSHVVRDDLIGWVDLSGSERIATEAWVVRVDHNSGETRQVLENEEAKSCYEDHSVKTQTFTTDA